MVKAGYIFLAGFILLIGQSASASGKFQSDHLESNSAIHRLEQYVLKNDKDSVQITLRNIEHRNAYYELLSRIGNEKNAEWSDYLVFYDSVTRRTNPDYHAFHDFFDRILKDGQRGDILEMDFAWLKWYQVENAANDLLDLDLASKLNIELLDYIESYGPSDTLVIKAKLLYDMHRMFMLHISRKTDEGMAIALANEEIARNLQDTTLLAITLFHKLNFLFMKKDIETYISTGEAAYLMEKNRKEVSPYFFVNLNLLTSAYVFQGGKEERVLELVNENYDKGIHPEQTYSQYIKLLESTPENLKIRKQILEKFDVRSVEKLVNKMDSLLQKDTDTNNKWRFSSRVAKLMVIEGKKENALHFIGKTVDQLQQVYSMDLSRALASHENILIKKEKEREVAIERKETKAYMIVAVIAALLMVVSVSAYYRKIRQNIEIREKSEQIEKQRNEIATQNEEKELLLKEIHHRVKNNLQIISSLLDLQSLSIKDETARNTFVDGQNRVTAMALIHEKLYQEEELSSINFADYAKELSNELSAIYRGKSSVKTEISSSQNLNFDIDTAIPLGLILNELISNAYKYAFKEKEEGQLIISLDTQFEGKNLLTVKDSGAGLPDAFDLSKTSSLGLKLVRRLARQLYGSVSYSNDGGAKFEVSFTNKLPRNLS